MDSEQQHNKLACCVSRLVAAYFLHSHFLWNRPFLWSRAADSALESCIHFACLLAGWLDGWMEGCNNRPCECSLQLALAVIGLPSAHTFAIE